MYTNSTGNNVIWTLFQANLAEIVITLAIEAVDSGTTVGTFYGDLPAEERPNMFLFNWWPDYNDAWNHVDPLVSTVGSSNGGKYSNPEVDALLTASRDASTTEEYQTAVSALQALLVEDPPAIYFAEPEFTTTLRRDIQGFFFNPINLATYDFHKMYRGAPCGGCGWGPGEPGLEPGGLGCRGCPPRLSIRACPGMRSRSSACRLPTTIQNISSIVKSPCKGNATKDGLRPWEGRDALPYDGQRDGTAGRCLRVVARYASRHWGLRRRGESRMELLDLLLGHDQWATARLLEASGGLTDAELDRELDIGHRTLRATFGHVIFNVPFWTAFLAGEPDDGGLSADAQPEDRSLAALRDAHERSYAAFAGVARRLRDEGRLGENFVDHYAVRKSCGGTILMVVEHNAEHRGEVLHILARLGVPDLPEVDLGAWEYLLLNT